MNGDGRRLVGLVLVSHSRRLAEGLAELAGQMAPDVPLQAAGGLPDGSLGTDYDGVAAALDGADHGAGVVLLYDLGSAQMTADLAVETLADPGAAVVVDAPFVEGTVAAAVAAQGGGDRDAVAAAAASAAAELGRGSVAAAERTPDDSAPPATVDAAVVEREIVLHNEIGLHARPAALLARAVAELDAEVEVQHGESTVDGKSVLGVMGLGARKGDTITVRATGPQADQAARNIVELAARDFDE